MQRQDKWYQAPTILALVLKYSWTTAAQQSKSWLTIIDSASHIPITSAMLMGIDHKNGRYSDDNGQLDLARLQDEEIVISCIGYETKTVPAWLSIGNDSVTKSCAQSHQRSRYSFATCQ